jgi:DNA polymerase-3 subunit epsilon
MRMIVLDTETTGISLKMGHRVIEIGCVEINNGMPTGKTFQQYINPQREVSSEAFQVHGLNMAFLAQFPIFETIYELFLDFVQDSPLIIHNAQFDMTFLNAETKRISRPSLNNTVIDTLMWARKKFPGAANSLDALCKRFQISYAHRNLHGALLDAQLLCQVYLKLEAICSQNILDLENKSMNGVKKQRPVRALRTFFITAQEEALYQAMIQELNKK